MSIFIFGTLLYEPLLRLVTGLDTVPELRPARLPDHAVCRAVNESYPMLAPMPGSVAEGRLVVLTDATALRRMDFYEELFGYVRADVTVQTDAGAEVAQVYVPRTGGWVPDGPWQLAPWAAKHGKLTLRIAGELMERFGHEPAGVAVRHHDQAEVRAASWLRAQADSAAPRLRRGQSADSVETHAARRPYRHFFMLEEQDISFPTFNGGTSAPVTRAAFVSGDAVTVLPYDPVRDRVMLIEQFRFGPFIRGDRYPWSLEAIAGRIDGDEPPEDTARREALEEAGLQIGQLEFVARYYPSPGAVTEYLYSYVALADLPDGSDGIAGLEEEAEDIRSHLLSFDAAMDLLASGEAENGPLVLSLLWLARNRDRLRLGA